MMMGMFGTAQDALLGFPAERPVFLREYSTNHYSVMSYFFSKMVKEFIVVLLQNVVFVSIFVSGMSCKVDCCGLMPCLPKSADEHQLLHDQFQFELRVLSCLHLHAVSGEYCLGRYAWKLGGGSQAGTQLRFNVHITSITSI